MQEIFQQNFLNIFELLFYFFHFSLIGSFFNRYLLKEKVSTFGIIKINVLALVIFYIGITLWNCFFPINSYIFVLFTGIALYELYRLFNEKFFVEYKSQYSTGDLIIYMMILSFIIWIANLSLQTLKYEPMYYIQKIRWAQSFPLIPGLGNLHHYLGIDNSIFLQIAYFDNMIFINNSLWSFSGYYLLLGFMYFFIVPINEVIIKKEPIKKSSIVGVLFFPILIHYCFYFHPGPVTDLPVFIFGAISGVEFYKIFIEKKNNYSLLLMSLAIAFTSKISILPTLFISFICIIIFHRKYLLSYIIGNKYLTLIIVLMLSLQLYRNIILTGYPLYPDPKLSIPVKWSMDRDEVESVSKLISDWAKGLRGTMVYNENEEKQIKRDFIYSRFFIQHRRIETLYPTIIGVLGIIFIIIQNRMLLKPLGVYSLPAIFQIIMFFTHAPDGRFASFSFWWLGAGFISVPLTRVFIRNKIYFWFFLFIIITASISIHTIDMLGQEKKFFINKISYDNPKVPEYSLYETNSGLKLNVPNNGQKCDDCPLPCTTFLRDNLRLQYDNDFKSGFYIR